MFRYNKGLTLIEMLIVVVIISILLLIFIPKSYFMTKEAKIEAMQMEASRLETSISSFYQENNFFPVKGGDISSFSPDIQTVLDAELSKRGLSSADYTLYGFKLIDENLLKEDLNGKKLNYSYFVATKTSISGMVFSTVSITNNQDVIHSGVYFAKKTPISISDTTPPSNVVSLAETHTDVSAHLSWSNPSDSDFSKIKIYRNGVLILTAPNTTHLDDTNLNPSTVYTYKVTTLDTSGNESVGVSIVVTTDNSSSNTITTNGLVGYWHYKQGLSGSSHGTTWQNIAPSTVGQYNGSINGNACVLNSNGLFIDGSFDCDPTMDKMPNTFTDFTAEVAVNIPDVAYSSWQTIICNDYSGYTWLYINSSGKLMTYNDVTSATLLNNTNYLITYVYKNGLEYVYVNGVNVLSDGVMYEPEHPPNLYSGFMHLGYNAEVGPLQGYIKSYKVYNRALTLSEIQQNSTVSADGVGL